MFFPVLFLSSEQPVAACFFMCCCFPLAEHLCWRTDQCCQFSNFVARFSDFSDTFSYFFPKKRSQLPVFLSESELMCLWLTVQTLARQLYIVNRKWILVRHKSCVTFCLSFTNPVTAPFICFMHCLKDMYAPCSVFTVIHVEQIINRMYCYEI